MDGVEVEEEVIEVNREQDEDEARKEIMMYQEEHFPRPLDDSYEFMMCQGNLNKIKAAAAAYPV